MFNAVDEKYAEFLKDFRTDLGGKKNFHNGLGGTYDCIAVFSYYIVCRDKTTFREIEELYGDFFTKPFKRLGFIDVNRMLCPIAEFAKKHDLLEVLPALCNVDFSEDMVQIVSRNSRKKNMSEWVSRSVSENLLFEARQIRTAYKI